MFVLMKHDAFTCFRDITVKKTEEVYLSLIYFRQFQIILSVGTDLLTNHSPAYIK